MSKCPKCGSIRIVETLKGDTSICLACESFFNTINGKSKPILFDRITASPEVLAEKLVYRYVYHSMGGTSTFYWMSTLFDKTWDTKAEALTATLEELNKV